VTLTSATGGLEVTLEVPVSPESFAECMAHIERTLGMEDDHMAADTLMKETLRSLGYEAGVLIYESMEHRFFYI